MPSKPAKKTAKKPVKTTTKKPVKKAAKKIATKAVKESAPKPVEQPGEVAAAMLAGLDRATALLPRFQEIADDVELDVDASRARLRRLGPGAALAEALPPKEPGGYYHHTWAGQSVVLVLLGRSDGLRADDVEVAGDLEIPSNEVRVTGNLKVGGDLKVEGNLVVVGDLSVGGVYTDAQGAAGVVAGSLSAGRAVLTEGFLAVGGATRAPFVLLDFNQGFAKLLGGVKARLFVEADHGGSRVFGALEVEHASFDECTFDDEPPALDVAALKAILRPELADLPEEPRAYDLSSALRQPAGEGDIFA